MKRFSLSPSVDRATEWVDELDDLLVERYPDLQSALFEGLQFILNALRKSEGMILIKNRYDSSPIFSIRHNVSKDLLSTLEEPDNQIWEMDNFAIRTMTFPVIGKVTLVPLYCRDKRQGLLFCSGVINDPRDQNFLLVAGQSIGRLVSMWRRYPGFLDLIEKFDNDLARLLASLDIEIPLAEAHFDVARLIQLTFGCQAVVLAFVSSEQERILVKKTLLEDSQDGLYQVSLEVGKGIIGQSIEKGEMILTNDPLSNPDYDELIDGIPDRDITALLSVPFKVGNRLIGAVALINTSNRGFSFIDQQLLMSSANSIASILDIIQLMHQLKTSWAEHEAGLWELTRTQSTLRSLFDNMPSSVYIIDQEYRLVAANLARAKRAGVEPEMLTGNLCYSALFQRSSPCPGCQVGDTLISKKITRRKQRVHEDGEETLEWDINTYPITNDKGQIIQAILFEQDVTESRRLESILAQSEKLAAIGQLAAGLAHEINNPLTVILANAQILQRELPENEDWKESLDLIVRAGSRALQVVRNLLGVSRKEEYELVPIDINENIQRALDLIQHEMAVRSVTLIFEPGKNLPLVMASADHLQGVWLNIILNALDATVSHPGGIVHISTFQHGNEEVRVTISDNGIGITTDRLKRIFEPFYTTKEPGRSTGGTGLGLSVSHRIVKQHGGEIYVESQVEKGTTFTVAIPIPEYFRNKNQ